MTKDEIELRALDGVVAGYGIEFTDVRSVAYEFTYERPGYL